MSNFIGALCGDIIGSAYEWHNAKTWDDTELFSRPYMATDDSVLSCAVADWLVETEGAKHEYSDLILKRRLREYGKMFPNAGYGGKFRHWLKGDFDEAYNSFGNGSAMRVAACGFFAQTKEEAMDLAKKSAEITHNHPEGIKGAQAAAVAIYMARIGCNKEEIIRAMEEEFGYDLTGGVASIKGTHGFNETCQGTLPDVLKCFRDSTSYENCLRWCLYIGGDSDTIACIAGGIAGAYYGVPSYISERCYASLPEKLKVAYDKFEKYLADRVKPNENEMKDKRYDG